MTVYINPPEACDICKGDFEGIMYDCFVPAARSWGNVCHDCFTGHRCTLGTGRGQKYVKNDAGKFVKVEG